MGSTPGNFAPGVAGVNSKEVRRVLSWMAVKELGYSGAAVARYLGVTNSCVTRAVSAEKVPQKEKYI
jgi:hypothetical protein